MADEEIVKVTTTVVENWQQLEFETEDLQVYNQMSLKYIHAYINIEAD